MTQAQALSQAPALALALAQGPATLTKFLQNKLKINCARSSRKMETATKG